MTDERFDELRPGSSVLPMTASIFKPQWHYVEEVDREKKAVKIYSKVRGVKRDAGWWHRSNLR